MDGIETTRPVKSIHRVSEARITRKNLLALMEDDPQGIKEGVRVSKAEMNLYQAIERFLKWCPHPERCLKICENAIAYNLKHNGIREND